MMMKKINFYKKEICAIALIWLFLFGLDIYFRHELIKDNPCYQKNVSVSCHDKIVVAGGGTFSYKVPNKGK